MNETAWKPGPPTSPGLYLIGVESPTRGTMVITGLVAIPDVYGVGALVLGRNGWTHLEGYGDSPHHLRIDLPDYPSPAEPPK